MFTKYPKTRGLIPILLFLGETLSPAVFLNHRFFGWGGAAVLRILILWLILALIFDRALSKAADFLSQKTDEMPEPWIHTLILSFIPILFLNLELLENFLYLKDLRPLSVILAGGGVLFLTIRLVHATRPKKPPEAIPLSLPNPSGDPHPRRTLWILFGSAYLIYIFLQTGWIAPRLPFTGDEPHYLLITHSLVADGDINLFNNYRDKDNLKFYPGTLDRHSLAGKRGESFQYSRHAPGLPFLLIPHYLLGNKLYDLWMSRTGDAESARNLLIFSARSFMALLTALLGLSFFRLVQILIPDRRVAMASWAVFAFTSPILFYSGLIYPEIPAAIILLFIFRAVIFAKSPSFAAILSSAAGIAFLPWLGIKYAVPAASAAILCLFTLYSRRTGLFSRLTAFLLPPILSVGGYFFFLWKLYGNVLPSSLYNGTAPIAGSRLDLFFHGNFWEFLRCGIGYLFDQRAGIFPFSPFYLLFIPGMILLARRSRGTVFKLLSFLLPTWIFYAMGYYWGGYCPPGRTLLPFIWILALFSAVTLSEPQRLMGRFFCRLAILATFIVTLILIWNPTWLYHEHLSFFTSPEGEASRLLTELSTPLFNFPAWVPSLSSPGPVRWLPLALALALTAGLTFLFVSGIPRQKENRDPHRIRGSLMMVLLISSLILAYVTFDINVRKGVRYENGGYVLYFQNSHHFGEEQGGFWTRGGHRTDILLSAPRRINRLMIHGSSPLPGTTILKIGPERHVLPRTFKSLVLSESFHSPIGFPWKGGFLYAISIHETSSFIPSESNPGSSDSRNLGLFIELEIQMEGSSFKNP